MRKFESLTAFGTSCFYTYTRLRTLFDFISFSGQNLSEIALHTAEWSPQRRPNKNEKSERADELPQPKNDADRKLRCTPPVATTGGFDIEMPNATLPRPTTTHVMFMCIYRCCFIADNVVIFLRIFFHYRPSRWKKRSMKFICTEIISFSSTRPIKC